MIPLAVFTAILSLTIILSQLTAFQRLKNYILTEINQNSDRLRNFHPKLSVILPCKGFDPDFDQNLKILLNQNYPNNLNQSNYEVIFILGDKQDDSYRLIEEAILKYPQINTKLLIAKPDFKNVHKLNSQLCGLKEIAQDSEVVVFVDSDVIANQNFLANLINPLQNSAIGLTTGYRFYVPRSFNIPGILRTIWNRVSAWEMANPNLVFAWGGAMAIKVDTIKKINLFKLWENCADDDLSLTKAVKQLNLQVKFVPQCLVASYADGSFAEINEWTNRQLLLTKFYYPELWFSAMIKSTVLFLFSMIQLIAFIQIILGQGFYALIILGFGLLLFLFELGLFLYSHKFWYQILIKSWQDNITVQQKLDLSFYESFSKSLLQFYIIIPLAHLVLPLISLTSIFINTLKWRGLVYKINKPHDIKLITS